MRITYKESIWIELTFEDNVNIDELISMIKTEGIYSVIDKDLGFLESQPLFNTELPLSPEENNGESTIEIYDSSDKLIWENGK